MTQDTLSILDGLFEKSPFLRADSVPSRNEIASAEIAVGIPFHEDYLCFLQRYGSAMVGPYPIFGLRRAPVMDRFLWSVVDVTRHFRKVGIDNIKSWVIISEDHAGNPIGMDDVGRIWIYDHDFGGVATISLNLERYIRDRCLKT